MRISPAELEVMNVLWTRAPQGAADIAAALESQQWNRRTVNTLLSRLVEKGALATEPDGRRHLYRPQIERAAYQRDAVRGFADRLFGGRAAPMVAHLADAEGLTADDIDELEQLIRSLKNDQ